MERSQRRFPEKQNNPREALILDARKRGAGHTAFPWGGLPPAVTSQHGEDLTAHAVALKLGVGSLGPLHIPDKAKATVLSAG